MENNKETDKQRLLSATKDFTEQAAAASGAVGAQRYDYARNMSAIYDSMRVVMRSMTSKQQDESCLPILEDIIDLQMFGSAIENQHEGLMLDIEQWLVQNGYCKGDKHGCCDRKYTPATVTMYICESARVAFQREQDIISLLPLFAEQLKDKPNIDIFDVLFCYGLDEDQQEAPQIHAIIQAARTELSNNAKKKPAQQRTQRAHKAAQNAGAIMTLGGRLGSFSQNDFWDVFTSNIIAALPKEVQDNALFDNGKLMMYSLNGKELQPVQKINGAALMAVCKAVFYTDMREYGDGNFTIALYLPAICKELGIDPRSATDNRRGNNAFKKTQREKPVSSTGKALTWSEQRTATMEKLLKPFDPDVARATDGSYYRLCVIEQYDAQKELLYVSSPFFFKLREIIALQADRHSALTTLFHADVANERNWSAVQLANRILAGIVRRGITRPDSKTYKNNDPAVSRRTVTKTAADGTRTTVTEQFQQTPQPAEEQTTKEKVFTWSDSFQSLVDECPQLRHELAAIENHADKDENGKVYHRAQAYNAKLKQTFAAAYRIILEKTDAPKYYKGLRFEPTNAKGEIMTPTKSTLRGSITIRHNGKNPDYSE